MGSIENSTKLTIMNIRERLMDYFKGTCVERMTQSGNVMLVKDYRISSDQHQYVRLAIQDENKHIMVIGNTKVFTLTNAPKKIVFYSCLDRSPQLREVKKEIERFMHDFLGGVEVSYIKRKQEERDDSELMKQTRLQENMPVDRISGRVSHQRMREYFISTGPSIMWTAEPMSSEEIVF